MMTHHSHSGESVSPCGCMPQHGLANQIKVRPNAAMVVCRVLIQESKKKKRQQKHRSAQTRVFDTGQRGAFVVNRAHDAL